MEGDRNAELYSELKKTVGLYTRPVFEARAEATKPTKETQKQEKTISVLEKYTPVEVDKQLEFILRDIKSNGAGICETRIKERYNLRKNQELQELTIISILEEEGKSIYSGYEFECCERLLAHLT